MKRRWLVRIATAPPLSGVLLLLFYAAYAGRRGGSDDADLGDVRRAEAVEAFIEHRFAAEITRMKIGIVATAIGVGLVVGLLAEVLLRLRHRAPALARRSASRALVEGVALCAAVHAAFVLWAMADTPQLYAARWYARGGLPRTVQVFATDVLGPRGVVLAALAIALLYVRPARLVAAARRARALLKRPFAALPLLFLWGPMAPLMRSAHEPPPLPAPSARGAFVLRTNAEGNGGGSAAASGSGSGSPNILLLAADSLRADRLNPRVAPTLSALAARGARFDRAYVSIPRTFPSWVTILTGRHAHHHGIRSMFPTWEERAKDFDALPARLAARGYATGVVSDYAGDIFGRIDLGFARVDTPSFDFRQLIRQRALERETPLLPFLHSRTGRRVFPVMRELSDAADPMLLAGDVASAIRAMKDRPFFLTAFFSTAHFPYAAPAPYYARYTDPSYRGRFKYHKPVGLGGEAAPDAADVAQTRALYDGAVTAIDDAVARVLAALEREGVAEKTIVVVTADHGETLYEDGHGQGHGDHLFGDAGTHVPLVIYDPRAAGAPTRSAAIVRDVDIAPTLYELAGVPMPTDLDGRSLAPAVRGAPVDARLAYAETELWFTEEIPGLAPDLRVPYPGVMGLTELDTRHNAEIVMRRDMVPVTRMARHRMVRDERFKLVYVPTRTGVRTMLFDTVVDPGETRDVAKEHPAEAVRLSAALWAWMLRDSSMEQRDGFLVPRSAP